MSGNKCRTPIYSRQRPAAIRPPPRGLVCLRLLSCPHISRVHWKLVNIPLPSVCTGRTQDEARPSETARPSRAEPRVVLVGVGSLWQTDPRLSAGWRPFGPEWLTNPNIAPPSPPFPRPPGCLCLLLSLLFAFNPRIRPIPRERSRREDGAGALGSAESQRGSALAV